jgi:hypothetical protein
MLPENSGKKPVGLHVQAKSLSAPSHSVMQGTMRWRAGRLNLQSYSRPRLQPETPVADAEFLGGQWNLHRSLRFVERGSLHFRVMDSNSTEIKRHPPYSMTMKMTKVGLSILLLTFALTLGSVALVHAPPPPQPPVIGTPVSSPMSPTSSDIVTVSVNVTSARSTIKNVTITYTTDNWKSTNTTIVATYNATTTTATGRIPALAPGAHVEYYIVAFDNSGNNNLNNNNGSYFAYSVSTPTSLTSITTITYILVAAGIAAAIAAVALMILKAPQSKTKQNKPSSNQDQSWSRNSS